MVGQHAGGVGARRVGVGGRSGGGMSGRKRGATEATERRAHWRRCAARGWRTPQPVQEQRGAVVEQQLGGAGARR